MPPKLNYGFLSISINKTDIIPVLQIIMKYYIAQNSQHISQFNVYIYIYIALYLAPILTYTQIMHVLITVSSKGSPTVAKSCTLYLKSHLKSLKSLKFQNLKSRIVETVISKFLYISASNHVKIYQTSS